MCTVIGMKMTIIFTVFCALMLVLIMNSGFVAFAVDPPANKTVTVEVTISEYAEITVLPTSLNWSAVNVGQTGGWKNLTVINTGTVNVTDLYVYADTLTDEVTRPYSIDNPQVYSAGGVITIINETGFNWTDGTLQPEKFYFTGRVEWNWTEYITNTDLSNLSAPVSAGFFKNTSREYFWAAGANSSGDNSLCNQTDAEFALDDDIDIGTIGTRTPSTVDIVHDASNKQWGIFSVNRAGSPLNGYCVAVNRTCDKIYIYKYDKRALFASCVNSQFLNTHQLTPGQVESLTLDIFAPRGLPAGTMKQATLTFVAS